MDIGSETSSQRPKSKLKGAIVGAAAVVGLVALGAGGYWAITCPCDRTPGLWLWGETHDEQVTDWTFANDVPLCQIQLNMGLRPHALNLNCMATPEGELYLSCSVGAQKYWCPRVEADHRGRLRLDGIVYPVVVNRVTDPATMDAAWAARISKLQKPAVLALQPAGVAPRPDAPRPDHWWTFHVESSPRS